MAGDNGLATLEVLGADVDDVEATVLALGDRAKRVSLWRTDEAKEPYIGRIDAAEFSLEYISERWGGGSYRMRVANGQNQWVKAMTFSIAGPRKVPGAVAISPAETAAPSPGTRETGMPGWLQAALLAAIPTVAAALASRLVAKPELDPIVLALLKRDGGGAVDAVQLAQMLETSRTNARAELLELMEDRGTGGISPSNWADVVRDVVPGLVSTWRREQDNERPRRRARAKVSGAASSEPRAADAAETTVRETTTREPRWLSKVRPWVPMALRLADQGKNAELQAAVMLDMLQEADVDELGDATLSASFVDDVFASIPEFASTATRRAWFTTFLEAIQAQFEPEDDETPGVGKPPVPLTPADASRAVVDG